MKSHKLPAKCPCESGKTYAMCCKPLHESTIANSAESLMRSRYSAYVLGLKQYLLDTWHPNTRPTTLDMENDEGIKWLGLSIKDVEEKKPTATVEFIARYKVGGAKAERLHEISSFEQLDRWYYLSGIIID